MWVISCYKAVKLKTWNEGIEEDLEEKVKRESEFNGSEKVLAKRRHRFIYL